MASPGKPQLQRTRGSVSLKSKAQPIPREEERDAPLSRSSDGKALSGSSGEARAGGRRLLSLSLPATSPRSDDSSDGPLSSERGEKRSSWLRRRGSRGAAHSPTGDNTSGNGSSRKTSAGFQFSNDDMDPLFVSSPERASARKSSIVRATSPSFEDDDYEDPLLHSPRPVTVSPSVLGSPHKAHGVVMSTVEMNPDVWATEHEPGSHEALVAIDERGVIISCNKGAQLLFGYSAGKMVGNRVEKLMPEPFSSAHQSHIDRFVRTGVSQGAIGTWKVRPALRCDGEEFLIRVALSTSFNPSGQYVFSSLIDPIYEATIRTNAKGIILSCAGSPWLLFGLYREALVSHHIDLILRRPAQWFAGVGERVVICCNSAKEDFISQLKMKKVDDSRGDGAVWEGMFCQAPALRVKMMVLKTGVISDCEGECKALLGYKGKALRGRPISDVLHERELEYLSLDKKSVVQMHHRNGRTVFVSIRATAVKDPRGNTSYQLLIKGHARHEFEGLGLKGEKLRYDGEVQGWYELGPSLGHGMCGPVKRAVHRLTGEEVAIKTLVRDRYLELGMKYPPPKIDYLDGLRHPNMVRTFDTIIRPEETLIIMELIDGGDMFDYVERMGALPEDLCRKYWRQLLSAVEFLHSRFVVHRDIKLENLVLDSDHNLKLIDFGFTCPFEPGEKFTVFCGSPDYGSPELVASVPYYGPDVDIWACGVVLYLWATSYLPFSNPTRIRMLKWEWPPGATPSPSLTQLLNSIFQPADRRATMEQLLAEEWGGPDIMWRGMDDDSVDEDIVHDMAEHYGWTEEEVLTSLKRHDHSQASTTYHLLDFHKRKKHSANASEPIFADLTSGSSGREGMNPEDAIGGVDAGSPRGSQGKKEKCNVM